jgi:two-component system heavy metal sensor histidine kinase CusS
MVATVIVVTGVTMGVGFAGVSAVFNRVQQNELDRALLDVARKEASEAPANGFSFDNRPGPAANDVGPLTQFGIIYDERETPLVATEPFERAPPPLSAVRHPFEQPFDYRFASKHLRCVIVPIPKSGKVMFVAASREDIDGDEAFLSHAMLAAFVLAVGWAGLLAMWMVRRQVRHHESIAVVARRVASGDLDARVLSQSSDPEVAQLGRDIDGMIEQLSLLMNAQQRFIAHAAHELRSPLAALYGELQQALRKPRDVASYQEAIEHALLASRRLNQLADDLLSLARPNTVEERDASVVTEEVVAHAVDLVGPSAKEKQVRIEVDVDGAPTVGRARDLERMLRNLLENAVQHAAQGDVVRVTARRSNGVVEFSVEDNGPGIPEEDRERIFEPFYRNAKSRAGAPRGAGLGLAIAREIARAHGGDVVLQDDAAGAKGARFVAKVPCEQGRFVEK